MRKIDVIQPKAIIERVDPNSNFELIFRLFDLTLNATVTILMSDEPLFTEPVIITPTNFFTSDLLDGTNWTSVVGNTVTNANGTNKLIKINVPIPNVKTIKYIKIKTVDSNSTILSESMTLSSVYDLNFSLKNPIELNYQPSKILVKDTKKITNGQYITFKVEACNNALDPSPFWEDLTSEYLNGSFYTFFNTNKEPLNKWALSVRYTITKTNKVGEISITNIQIAHT